MMRTLLLGAALLATACNTRNNVQCEVTSNCDLTGGGMCITAPTGNKWCAYPDPACPGGYRYSDQDIGDGLSGVCVGEGLGDAGVDVGPDATPPSGWTRAFSSARSDFARSVALDPAGNTYVVGSFYGDAVLAGQTVTSNGSIDVFVAKFSTDGQLLWLHTFGGSGADDAFDVDADGSRVVIVGKFFQAVDFGTGPISAAAGGDGFVLALDPAGHTLWVDHRAASGNLEFRRVDIGASAIYAGGDFFGTLTLPSGAVTSRMVDLVAMKYDLMGNAAWGTAVGGSDYDFLNGLAVTADGNVAIGGSFHVSLDMNAGPVTALGGNDIFVEKLSSANGTPVWTKRFGGTDEESLWGLRQTSAGLVFVGCFAGQFNVNATLYTSAGMSDGLTIALAGDGSTSWVRTVGGASADCAYQVAETSSGLLVAGNFMDSMQVGGTVLQSLGAEDVWLARYDNSGLLLAAKKGGGMGVDKVEGLASAGGWAVIAGNSRGAPDWFGLPLPPLDLFSDGVVVHLSSQ